MGNRLHANHLNLSGLLQLRVERLKGREPRSEMRAASTHCGDADVLGNQGSRSTLLKSVFRNFGDDSLGWRGSLSIVDQLWTVELLGDLRQTRDLRRMFDVLPVELFRIGEQQGFELVQLDVGNQP
jgi:hypothetical protein